MKKLIFIIHAFLVASCTSNYTLRADLGIVSDENRIDKRLLSMHYHAVNDSQDSIFIPIGYEYDNLLKAEIVLSDSFDTYIWHSNSFKYKGRKTHKFAPGDTIWITSRLNISAKNSADSAWLHKVSIQELVKKIHISMSELPKSIKKGNIPNIVFNNQTTDINFNPIIQVPEEFRSQQDASQENIYNCER